MTKTGSMRIKARVGGIERLRAAIDAIKTELITPKVMESLCDGLKERIVDRTISGQDASGAAFTSYSPGYAKRRVRLGKKDDVVTLSVTGAMLGAINAQASGKEGVVTFVSGKEGEKARYHQVIGAGRQRVKRKFFALSEADRGWVLRTLHAHVDAVIIKAFRKG